jgi:hypothetical protein
MARPGFIPAITTNHPSGVRALTAPHHVDLRSEPPSAIPAVLVRSRVLEVLISIALGMVGLKTLPRAGGFIRVAFNPHFSDN